MLSLAETNRRARASEAACEAALPRLMAAYHLAIIRLSRVAVENFVSAKTVVLVAAAEESWSIPDLDELFTLQYGADVIEEATREARRGLALAATGPWASATDPAVRDRLTGTVLQLLAHRITEVTEHVREHAAVELRGALDEGLSIPNTAKRLSTGFRDFAPARARLIARTEMIGAANAASLAAVRETGAASHKRWLATNDARTRPTHSTANGQVRPVDDPFDVGGAQLMYPGAEGAPAREVCNCRCTLVYEDDPARRSDSATSAEFLDPSEVSYNDGLDTLPSGVQQSVTDDAFSELKATGLRGYGEEGGMPIGQPLLDFADDTVRPQAMGKYRMADETISVNADFYADRLKRFPAARAQIEADMRGTIHHEYGHHLDAQPWDGPTSWRSEWADGVSGRAAADRAKELREVAAQEMADLVNVFDAINASKPIRELVDALPGMTSPSNVTTTQYLLNPKEKFARAFHQWVSVHAGGDPQLAKAVVRHMNQWDPADFAAIDQAMTAYMRSAGWLAR